MRILVVDDEVVALNSVSRSHRQQQTSNAKWMNWDRLFHRQFPEIGRKTPLFFPRMGKSPILRRALLPCSLHRFYAKAATYKTRGPACAAPAPILLYNRINGKNISIERSSRCSPCKLFLWIAENRGSSIIT